MRVYAGDNALIKDRGYIIFYPDSRSKTFKKSNMKTVKGSNTTAMRIKLPKAGKKYYVKVRTYKTVEGKKICSKWFKARWISYRYR